MSASDRLTLAQQVQSYLMIKSLKINNFRCFKSIEVDQLRRVNLIVGSNGSGKTALLESLFIAGGGSPQMYFNTLAWRGMTKIHLSTDQEGYDSSFKGIFHLLDKTQVAQVSFSDSESGTRSLTVSYPPEETFELLESEADKFSTGRMRPIRFEWRLPGGRSIKLALELKNGEFPMQAFDEAYNMHFVNVGTLHSANIWARHFSTLSKRKRVDPVIQDVQRVFPEIEDISLELQHEENVLYASVAGLSERIPLNLVSAGVSKFVALLLAIHVSRKGTVLIDEIENGLYYRLLPRMWKVLVEAARSTETQLIATTHSMECIAALSEAMQDQPDEIRLLRAERDSLATTVKEFEGQSLIAAVEQGHDVR